MSQFMQRFEVKRGLKSNSVRSGQPIYEACNDNLDARIYVAPIKFILVWRTHGSLDNPLKISRLLMLPSEVLRMFGLFVVFGLYVTFNNFSVLSWRCLDVTGSSMLTCRVLPHRNITP